MSCLSRCILENISPGSGPQHWLIWQRWKSTLAENNYSALPGDLGQIIWRSDWNLARPHLKKENILEGISRMQNDKVNTSYSRCNKDAAFRYRWSVMDKKNIKFPFCTFAPLLALDIRHTGLQLGGAKQAFECVFFGEILESQLMQNPFSTENKQTSFSIQGGRLWPKQLVHFIRRTNNIASLIRLSSVFLFLSLFFCLRACLHSEC